MSTGYLLALGLVAALLLAARVASDALPVAAAVRAPTQAELGALAVGILGLVLHCGAMFFRSTFIRIPGSAGPISTINAMGLGSQLWYLAAAVLVLVGLRSRKPLALLVLGLGLVLVGITMYDSGPVRVHLVTIFATVTLLALLVPVPRRPARAVP